MPVPGHTRMTFSGVYGALASPVEIWQFGINAYSLAVTDVPAHETAAAAAATAWTTHMASLFRADVRLTRVRVATITSDSHVEKTAAGAYRQGDANVDTPGTVAGTTALPLSTALAVSLTTVRAGAEGKGRFFLPWPALPIGTDYRLSVSDATAVADKAKSFLNALKPLTEGGPAVVSPSKNLLTAVTGLRVGRVPDTMRSRRSGLVEGYVVRTL